MLKIMGRNGYTVDTLYKIAEVCDNKIDLSFEMVVGHPYETEELFMETVNNIKKINPTNVIVECFYQRENTPAYNMDDNVPYQEKVRRKKYLEDLFRLEFNEYISEYNKLFNNEKKNLKPLKVNLYDINEVIKLFNNLSQNKYSDIYIENDYDEQKNNVKLNVYIKLLKTVFNIHIVNNIYINNKNINENYLDLANDLSTKLCFHFDEEIKEEYRENLKKLTKIILNNSFFEYKSLLTDKLKKHNKWFIDDMINNNINLTEEEKLYTNNTGRKSFQWELWQYCNSLCDFCYLGEENRIHNKERQIQSIKDLNLAIDNMNFNKYNNISLIGGEFFQGQLNDPEVHDLFFDTIKKIFKCYQDKKIGSMWFTCTLTLGDQKHLYELLDLADSMNIHPKEEYGASGLWLCTSWDAAGRFHTPGMQENWEYHMKNIKQKYPWIKFNTTIILQQAFIDMYLEGKFSAKQFMKDFNTTLFFKQCGIPPFEPEDLDLPEGMNIDTTDPIEHAHVLDVVKMKAKQRVNSKFTFFPTRHSFIKFLIKFYNEDRECYDRLFNIIYRSDELHRNFIKNEHDVKNDRYKTDYGPEETGKECLPCGHTETYAAYIDNNACCICDRNMVADQF